MIQLTHIHMHVCTNSLGFRQDLIVYDTANRHMCTCAHILGSWQELMGHDTANT
eukprot:c33459_g1_i1 orf=57-218(+)